MEYKNRLVLLDILRAIGVMLMIEGHTIDAVMSPIYKDASSMYFQFWTFFRGLTAPFFFFSAGLAFVVATVKFRDGILSVSGRTKMRRLKRIVALLLIGYGLHVPIQMFYNPSVVPQASWNLFFVADALQIISFSLLAILVIALVSRNRKTLLRALVVAALLSLALSPITEAIRWERFMHPALYPYLTFRAGSFFTFFPFSGFLFSGAAFGAAAIGIPAEIRAKQLAANFAKASAVSLFFFAVFYMVQMRYVSPHIDYWKSLPAVNLLRFGLVTMVASVVSLVSLRMVEFPRMLPAIGRSSLTVYVVHLMIVYGSPVNDGLSQLLVGGIDPFTAALVAVGVMALMFAMVYTMEAFRAKKRRVMEVTAG